MFQRWSAGDAGLVERLELAVDQRLQTPCGVGARIERVGRREQEALEGRRLGRQPVGRGGSAAAAWSSSSGMPVPSAISDEHVGRGGALGDDDGVLELVRRVLQRVERRLRAHLLCSW